MPITAVYQRKTQAQAPKKTILEELAEIDQAMDQDESTNKPSSPESSKSIQPSLSIGQNNEPPSSSLPLTPNNRSTLISHPKPNIEIQHQPDIILSKEQNDLELPSLEETFQPIPDSDQPHSQPDPEKEPTPVKQSKSTRRILESDDEDDVTREPNQRPSKSKKRKGLTKKEKEEAQRVIASCERKRNVRLAASCRAPLTRIEDIINKATRAVETPSIESIHSDHPTKNSEDHRMDPAPTNQILDLSDNDDDEGLPNPDELMSKSNDQSRSLKSEKNKNNVDPEEALQKKEWLKNQRKTVLEPNSLVASEELPETIDSDSDLDVVQEPAKSTVIEDQSAATDPFAQRLNQPQSHSRSTKSQPVAHHKKSALESLPIPFFSTALNAATKTRGRASVKPKENDLMQGLLVKSALEGALIRQKKRSEFLDRGGRLAKETQTTSNPSEVGHVNLKAILKNSKVGAKPDEDEEDDIECDWDEDEIELSGEEEVEQIEGNEDEIEDSQEEEVEGDDMDDLDVLQDTTIRPAEEPNDLENAEDSSFSQSGLKISKDSRILCSESSCTSLQQPVKKAHQRTYDSNILAPDSNSTDRDSSEPDPQLANPLNSHSRSSSPINLPGFNLDQHPKSNDLNHSKHGRSSSNSSDGNSNSLPGFKLANKSENQGLSELLVDGCSQIEGFNTEFEFKSGKNTANQNPQTGFTQLFGEEEGQALNFTHPPPLLKPKIQVCKDGDVDGDRQEEDLDEEIPATCVLPAVNVLPEERERDMLMMLLGAQKTTMECDDQPMEYVNHRGLLTQHKPNGPPDSPLMSQDPVSRTPFALRKGINADPVRQMEEGHSPTKIWNIGRRESRDRVPNSPTLLAATSAKPRVQNAFTKIMDAQNPNGPTSPTAPKLPSGRGKMFLADEADESEDEYETFGGRLGGHESSDEEGSQTEEAQKMLEELVDDGEDARDEKSKLEGDLAMQNLAKQHLEQLDQKRTEQIQKIIDGKVRIQKARGSRHGAGISDSDSEDDNEAETYLANKRAQENAGKKKKKAIDLLANKHESFFKSYQEGTSQWVDDDDLAYLQPPPEDQNKKSDELDSDEESEADQDEDEDDEDQEELLEDILEMGTRSDHKGKEKSKLKTISSSPPINSDARRLPFKINDQFKLQSSTINPPKNFKTLHHAHLQPSTSKSHSNAHHDLDKMYDGLKSTKDSLTERHRRLVAEELGGAVEGRSAEGDKARGAGSGMRERNGNNRINHNQASSITYQQQQHRKLQARKAQPGLPAPIDKHREPSPAARSHQTLLSKLKQKKK